MKTLERRLGLGAVIAISVSAMLGSGIFVLPGLAAGKTGSMVWLAYLFAGLGVLPAALSKSELATAMPTSGGTYVYLERTFGPFAGTVSGLGLWFSLLLKSAFALVGFGAYLSVLIDLPPKPVALTLLFAITLINVMGVSLIGTLQKFIVGTVLVALLVLGFKGLFSINPELFEGGFSHGSLGFISAAAFVYISYAGVTKVAAIAEEVKNPGRNLPLGILLSWLLVLCVYVFVVFVLAGNVSSTDLKTDLHPIYTLARIVLGETAGVIAAVLATVTMVSMAVAGLLAASRFPFAMSRDDLMPPWIKSISFKFKTPVNSILLTSLVMGLGILLLPVEQLAKLASAFMILAFMFVCGTVLILRETAAKWYKPEFRAPFYPWLQILGIVIGLVLLFAIGVLSLIAISGIVGIGSVAYLGYGRKNSARQGVVGKMGTRRGMLEAGLDTALELNQSLPVNASVVVPFFGNERSPETLVEMGAALAQGRSVEVLHITAVPEQVHIGDVLEEDPLSVSLRRRIRALADDQKIALEYNDTVTHDVVQTIYSVAVQVKCEWVVMEAAGRRDFGITFHNPIGWLQDHLPCNLAVFQDAGIRTIRKILVYAEPGPHDSLVVLTADRLAEIHGAELEFICVVDENSNDHHRQAKVDYVDQLKDLCVAPANAKIVSGTDELNVIEKLTPQYDLLVMGAPRDRSRIAHLLGSPKDKLTRRADCSVLWLKTARTQSHTSFDQAEIRKEDGAGLLDVMVPDCLVAHAKITKKEELFRVAAELFSNHYPEISPIVIGAALWEREQMQNTSLGSIGMALPHATLAQAPNAGTSLGIITLENPIDYGASDNSKLDVFVFTMGSPSDRQVHLRVMAEISKLTINTKFLSEIRSAKDAAEMKTIIESCVKSISS
ncbi:MAG: amino acid permease [Mariniblastus sp.]